MLHEEDIIRDAPIDDYFLLTPTEHKIFYSQLQSGKDYVLKVQIENITKYVLAWRIRTKRRSRLEYKPVIKASCIPPNQVFNCDIVVSVKENITKELLQTKKVDKFQIQGTILPNIVKGKDLDSVLAQRTKLQDKEHRQYVFQEMNFKCHLPQEPVGLDLTTNTHIEQGLQRSSISHNERKEPVVNLTTPVHRRTGQIPVSKPTSEYNSVACGELGSLRKKAKQHDELIWQVQKIMKERDEYQLKLDEQCTQNILMWKQLSNLKEEVRKLKYGDNRVDELKSNDYAKMFFEDFPKEQLIDFKQPKSISVSMAASGLLFAYVFYMLGKCFGS